MIHGLYTGDEHTTTTMTPLVSSLPAWAKFSGVLVGNSGGRLATNGAMFFGSSMSLRGLHAISYEMGYRREPL
jgi:hypothetical protein